MKRAPKSKPSRVEITLEPQLLPGLIVRCRECGQFGLRGAMSVAGCTVCDWHTARCEKCGGESHAEHGVRAHHAYFATTGVAKYGDAHVGDWRSYQEWRTRRAKFKLLPPSRSPRH
jgi:hypothetical protein